MSTPVQNQSRARHVSPRASTRQDERIRIRAARLRVTTDKKLGRTTPEWVKELAQRKL